MALQYFTMIMADMTIKTIYTDPEWLQDSILNGVICCATFLEAIVSR